MKQIDQTDIQNKMHKSGLFKDTLIFLKYMDMSNQDFTSAINSIKKLTDDTQ